jgi:hypothetical protein
VHATFGRDHEYKRHGTVSLLAGIDLLTGQVHALVRDRHRSREFIEFLQVVDAAYPPHTAIKVILDNHSAHISKETNAPIGSPPDVRQTVPQERGRCLGGRYWTVLGSQIAPDERHQKVAGHQLVDHSPTGRTFRRYVCPERSIPADSLAVHGLSAEFSVCARRPSRRFGVGVASGKRLIVIGYRENVFRWLAQVAFYDGWEDFLRRLTN